MPALKRRLEELTREFHFSIPAGELQILDGGWYVTHTGLLALARRKRCRGMHVEAVDALCDSAASRFVLKATVYPSKGSAGFVGYGDADPSNVSPRVRGAEMRIAETRAVNRALRKAYVGWAKGLSWRSLPASRDRASKVQPGCTKLAVRRRKSSNEKWRKN